MGDDVYRVYLLKIPFMAKENLKRKNIDLSEEDIKTIAMWGLESKNLGFKLFVQSMLHELAEKQRAKKKSKK